MSREGQSWRSEFLKSRRGSNLGFPWVSEASSLQASVSAKLFFGMSVGAVEHGALLPQPKRNTEPCPQRLLDLPIRRAAFMKPKTPLAHSRRVVQHGHVSRQLQ